MESRESTSTARPRWNKRKIVGQKTPLKLKEIWAIRVRLQLARRFRELAVCNLAIDCKLRACEFVKLKVRDVCHGQSVASRTIVMQQKTQRPVQFEITEPTREAVSAGIGQAALSPESSVFPSRIHSATHLSTRQPTPEVQRIKAANRKPTVVAENEGGLATTMISVQDSHKSA